MKKAYEKPFMEVTEFRFSEHIAASGTSCQWQEIMTNIPQGCIEVDTHTGQWIGPG